MMRKKACFIRWLLSGLGSAILPAFLWAQTVCVVDDQVDYPVGSLPIALISGDFNGDGLLDLAVANQNSGNISILLGKGDGTFAPAQTISVGTGPSALVAGDFNG